MEYKGVKAYYGAASGQQRSALRRLSPEGVMISHATCCNTPWDGPDTFIDCGGYHHMENGNGEYGDSDEEYIEYLLDVGPHLYALRDYPCAPDLLKELGRSVAEQQQRTTDHHIQLYDKLRDAGIADNAVSVVQGWTPNQYIKHVDTLKEHGLLTDPIAVGSICRPNESQDIAEVIIAVEEELPPDTDIHAFGIRGNVLKYHEVVEAISSFDSSAYDYASSRVPSERSDGETFTWRDSARGYLNWRHEIKQNMGSEHLNTHHQQESLVSGWG